MCLLLLLLSHFSHVQLCATPQTVAHQTPPSLGFSKQEYWSGLPFPSPTIVWPQVNKQRHYFTNKGPSSQGYGFFSGHVWMWELDYEESWTPKKWCFWTVVLEKTFESPFDYKEMQPVYPKGDQSWVFVGRNAAKAETPIPWPPDPKSWLIGNDWCWKGLGAGGEGDDRGWDG